jgi:16S rRNA (guanine527-N7)-methyltransferase
LADVGSGGGLPGIPLAILRPDLQLTLIEPRAKRVAFLRGVSHELVLRNVKVLRCRSEDVPKASFSGCYSRATFPPAQWLEVGRELVKADGIVIVLANDPWTGSDTSTRLGRSLQYTSGSGRSRWLGSFCFT